MRIAILCATRRGYRFVQTLAKLAPRRELLVFSFREEPWEPRYLDDIRGLTVESGGRFFEAAHVGSPQWSDFWTSTPIDLMFVVSWRFIIPNSVYRRARLGAYVFHDSLLPRYRGFSPTVWSIINGETHTGVTLFEMSDGFDEGDVIAQRRVPIGPDQAIAEVLEQVTDTYMDLLRDNLECLVKGTATRHPQDHERATYTSKRLPDDNEIDWTASTNSIFNLVRAVSEPYSGAYTYLAGHKIRVWAAKKLPNPRQFVGRIPGRVVEVRPGEGTVVLTGDGCLLLTRVQPEGGEVVCAADVLHAQSQTLGG